MRHLSCDFFFLRGVVVDAVVTPPSNILNYWPVMTQLSVSAAAVSSEHVWDNFRFALIAVTCRLFAFRQTRSEHK